MSALLSLLRRDGSASLRELVRDDPDHQSCDQAGNAMGNENFQPVHGRGEDCPNGCGRWFIYRRHRGDGADGADHCNSDGSAGKDAPGNPNELRKHIPLLTVGCGDYSLGESAAAVMGSCAGPVAACRAFVNGFVPSIADHYVWAKEDAWFYLDQARFWRLFGQLSVARDYLERAAVCRLDAMRIAGAA